MVFNTNQLLTIRARMGKVYKNIKLSNSKQKKQFKNQ